MSKRNKLRKQVEAKKSTSTPNVGLKVGDHQFPVFNGLSASFGARGSEYPRREAIPEEFYAGNTKFNRVFSSLFFSGGSLSDHGLSIKPGLDKAQVITAIRSLMCSFDPKHEIKEATVAWALSEWCDVAPEKAGA